MTAGILVVFRPPSLAGMPALCVGETESAAAWFVDGDATIFVVTWREFHARFALVGYFEPLGTYRFTSPERARADCKAGVFLSAHAFAAAVGSRLLASLGGPRPG